MALMVRYSGHMKSQRGRGETRHSKEMAGRGGEGGFCYYTRTIGNPGHVKHLTTEVGNHKSRRNGEGTWYGRRVLQLGTDEAFLHLFHW